MGILQDKTCVITGGSGSLGLASAAAFVREGGNVMLVDLDKTRLIEAVQTLQAAAGQVAWCVADVSDVEQTRHYIAQTVATFGKIDVLFLNAGSSGETKPITDFSIEVFDQVMAVNVRAPFLGMKFGLPEMNDGGSVIVTSSIMGVQANGNISAYATSKHAVIGLVRSASKEVARRNIRVNAIAPGPLDNAFQQDIEDRLSAALGFNATEMINQRIPLGRHSQPEEVAEMVLFLASDRSSFSTGSVFMSDGGLNA